MREIVVQTHFDRRGGWVVARLALRGEEVLPMVIDTGAFYSAISERTRAELMRKALLEGRGGNRYILRDVTIDGHPIGDIPVRLSRRVSEVGAIGLLGLDFLGRYA